ncbi:hypothetical protein H4V99_001759 [Cryobacterium sp. CG_9.6]|nr:hypothetical protein [Cryobacterium sp. CG_9.6]
MGKRTVADTKRGSQTMAQVENESTPEIDTPYQSVAPNLDKLSRSSFTTGTVSRRRINRAFALLAGVGLTLLALVLASLDWS